MIGQIGQFEEIFESLGTEIFCPKVVQTLSEEELIELVPEYDGWIIGDDPATSSVFEAGAAGRLKAAVKWGVGVDNVDYSAAEKFGVHIANTPGMFGNEVADVAIAYTIGLARNLFEVDHSVREGAWPKPAGRSLLGKQVALVGFGSIGQACVRRLLAAGMQVTVYDPGLDQESLLPEGVKYCSWPLGLEEMDFVILTCSLTKSSRHMINERTIQKMKDGVYIVNVARGALIDENALTAGLGFGKVASVALDVFEKEPLPLDSKLRTHPHCIFGSHNSSNTVEAVERTSLRAIELLMDMFHDAEGRVS